MSGVALRRPGHELAMRTVSRTLVLVLLLALVLPLAPAAAQEVTPARVGGSGRIETAAEVAELTYDPQATGSAVIASAADFPDALSAVGVAGAAIGPVLLTWPDRLPERIRQALENLMIEQVYIVGGESAVSARIANELSSGRDVRRIAGPTRYATAAQVARFMAATGPLGTADGDTSAILASGTTFADALTAGPLAYQARLPVLLTPPDRLATPTSEVVDELGIEHVILSGGTQAVSEQVADELRARGVTVERIAGATRTETATAFADALLTRFGFDASTVLLARGEHFPDSLAAGPRGGALTAPILLAEEPERLGPMARDWLAQACPSVSVVQAVGGPSAVAPSTLDAAEAAAESCETAQRTLTYEVGTLGAVEADVERFRDVAAATLNDPRGWAIGGDLAFEEVADGGDFRLWLADPQEVDAAAPECDAQWSCRVGDDVYINEERWAEATQTYADRTLFAYRQYVINHEVGHWLGLDHADCPGAGQPAPVMQQQSISLDGCETNVWPLEWEQQAVRERWLQG
jgi:putative cell wall-binding protein